VNARRPRGYVSIEDFTVLVLLLIIGLVLLAMVTPASAGEVVRYAAKDRATLQRSIEAQEELLARKCETSLRTFYKWQWPLVEPMTPRVDNWHVDATCDHLQATVAAAGEAPQITKLAICMPPRNGKSTTTCVAYPAWVWGPRNLPGKRFIFTSYRLSLARRDSRYTRNVITADRYRQNWGDRFELRRDQKTKDRYDTDHAGYRMIGSFKGGVTGEGCDVLAVDDPIDTEKADNANELERVIEVWDKSLVSRLNDQTNGVRIMMMQRVAEGDLVAHVLKQGGWEYLRLPAEFEIEDRCRTFISLNGEKRLFFEDPRTEEGELLNPKRFPREVQDTLRTNEWVYAAQQQQRPAPRGGQILQEAWWRYYDTLPLDAQGKTRKPDHGAQSWDLAFKDLKTSDFIACLVGELYGPDIYLRDYFMERRGFGASCDEIRQMRTRHPHLSAILVEDKANGPAVIETLTQEIAGIIGVEPQGGKIARAFAAQPTLKSGNIYLPNPDDPQTGKPVPGREWVRKFVKNCAVFPKGLHDDDVDAFTQLTTYLRGTHSAMLDFLKQMKARDAAKAEAGRG